MSDYTLSEVKPKITNIALGKYGSYYGIKNLFQEVLSQLTNSLERNIENPRRSIEALRCAHTANTSIMELVSLASGPDEVKPIMYDLVLNAIERVIDELPKQLRALSRYTGEINAAECALLGKVAGKLEELQTGVTR